MMTRSRTVRSHQMNWTNLPTELVAVVLSYFKFKQIAKFSEINRLMVWNVDHIMRYINAIDDKLSVESIDYICKKCHALKEVPYICGAKNYDLKSMRKLLTRWPDQMHLNWDMTNSIVISSFLQSLSRSSFRRINHLSLKITELRLFSNTFFSKTSKTKMNISYMNLSTLTIDAEGCDLESILIVLNCRCWDVYEIYLRGDVANLGSLLIYIPAVMKITIINTMDTLNSLSLGTEHGLRFLLNSTKNVHLCNILKFCCDPPYACSIVDLFIYAVTTSMFTPTNGTWTVDRLNVDMIEALVTNSITVNCGVFKSEMKALKLLEEKYPDKIFVTSVF